MKRGTALLQRERLGCFHHDGKLMISEAKRVPDGNPFSHGGLIAAIATCTFRGANS